jgi:CheY-like chemotaxis protein
MGLSSRSEPDCNAKNTKINHSIMSENLKGKKLIVLEDDVTSIFLIKALLEKEQADAVYCRTVDEFLDVYKGDKDIVLLDISVPGDKDGLDLLQELKAKEPSTPIIMQTAYSELEAHCKSLGADGFVDKPITADKLITAIVKLLNKLKNES